MDNRMRNMGKDSPEKRKGNQAIGTDDNERHSHGQDSIPKPVFVLMAGPVPWPDFPDHRHRESGRKERVA